MLTSYLAIAAFCTVIIATNNWQQFRLYPLKATGFVLLLGVLWPIVVLVVAVVLLDRGIKAALP